MRGLDRLQIHKGLKAGHQHEARSLTCHGANSTENPSRILLDLSMLSRDHQHSHHLANDDQDTAKDGCLLGVETFE